MLYATLKTLHVLSIVVWIGGMFFAHFCLRPAVAALDPPVRLKLMHEVLGRFFGIVLVASLITLFSGLWMIGRVARQAAETGGHLQMPIAWTLMAALGLLMVAIFMHIRFALYRRLSRAVAAADWPAGGAAMASIRTWVSVNLAIGVFIVGVTLLGQAG